MVVKRVKKFIDRLVRHNYIEQNLLVNEKNCALNILSFNRVNLLIMLKIFLLDVYVSLALKICVKFL